VQENFLNHRNGSNPRWGWSMRGLPLLHGVRRHDAAFDGEPRRAAIAVTFGYSAFARRAAEAARRKRSRGSALQVLGGEVRELGGQLLHGRYTLDQFPDGVPATIEQCVTRGFAHRGRNGLAAE